MHVNILMQLQQDETESVVLKRMKLSPYTPSESCIDYNTSANYHLNYPKTSFQYLLLFGCLSCRFLQHLTLQNSTASACAGRQEEKQLPLFSYTARSGLCGQQLTAVCLNLSAPAETLTEPERERAKCAHTHANTQKQALTQTTEIHTRSSLQALTESYSHQHLACDWAFLNKPFWTSEVPGREMQSDIIHIHTQCMYGFSRK